MSQVQVIAGPEERLAMARPVVTELLHQWTGPLLGLDTLVEVLHGRLEPTYHCTLCSGDLGLQEVVPHLAAPRHILLFLQQHLPPAWARLAPSPDPQLWGEQEFLTLDQVVARVEGAVGRRRPAMASSTDDLPRALERLKVLPYSSKALDSFFRTLPLAEAPKVQAVPSGVAEGRSRRQEVALTEGVEVGPGGKQEVVARVLGTFASDLAGKWCLVDQGAGVGGLLVQGGLARLWLDDLDKLCLKLVLLNTGASGVTARQHSKVAQVRWRE